MTSQSPSPTSALNHFIRVEDAARNDLAAKLRSCARALLAEADTVATGGQVATHATRSDIRDLDHVLLAYDKAREALRAARAVAGEVEL